MHRSLTNSPPMNNRGTVAPEEESLLRVDEEDSEYVWEYSLTFSPHKTPRASKRSRRETRNLKAEKKTFASRKHHCIQQKVY